MKHIFSMQYFKILYIFRHNHKYSRIKNEFHDQTELITTMLSMMALWAIHYLFNSFNTSVFMTNFIQEWLLFLFTFNCFKLIYTKNICIVLQNIFTFISIFSLNQQVISSTKEVQIQTKQVY